MAAPVDAYAQFLEAATRLHASGLAVRLGLVPAAAADPTLEPSARPLDRDLGRDLTRHLRNQPPPPGSATPPLG
ncbi:hypothetical protein E1264_09810 [Actinomadura sp. KC216]|uniref:hypothetical protein n=1 Tax=Actinomadura sp. KC216 TaxID=2530370 RepID=UPI00104C6E1D|nr:hypothetical protein [Actinomadura sp. KC216]TDB88974.1 hypothetical protein E1264_09810 [Actinomadura sp. KC216]